MKKKSDNQGFQPLVGAEVSALYLGGCAPWRPADTSYAVTRAEAKGGTLTVTLEGGYSGTEIATLVVVDPGPLEKTAEGRFVIKKARSVRFNGEPYLLGDDDAVQFS